MFQLICCFGCKNCVEPLGDALGLLGDPLEPLGVLWDPLGTPWPMGPGFLAQGSGPLGPGTRAPWPRGPGLLAQGPGPRNDQGKTYPRNQENSKKTASIRAPPRSKKTPRSPKMPLAGPGPYSISGVMASMNHYVCFLLKTLKMWRQP